MLSETAIYSATPGLCPCTLLETGHTELCIFWWIKLVSQLPLAYRKVRLFLFLVCECCALTWKITTCSDRFHASVTRSHVLKFHVYGALTPIWNTGTYKRKSYVWYFTFALHVHVTSSCIDGIPVLNIDLGMSNTSQFNNQTHQR